eukprot:scaffold7683_cov51-Phaeocystis_antarctica.AAC.2
MSKKRQRGGPVPGRDQEGEPVSQVAQPNRGSWLMNPVGIVTRHVAAARNLQKGLWGKSSH